MKPARVLVTGATGQLGSAIAAAFAGHDITTPGSATLDIGDAAAVRAVVEAAAPDVIVNCAAYNNVDAAEDRPLDALAVNAFGVRNLARAAVACRARLVHYSTDFVFDGEAPGPYTEVDAPAPRSTYGASKLLGEWFALDAPGALVLRVESLFGTPLGWTGRRGTLDAIVDGLLAGREVTVFHDRVISPGHTGDIAAATRHLIETGAPGGIYHCVNTGAASWHAVAEEAARILGVSPRLRSVAMRDVPMRAARPLQCAFSNQKLADTGFAMPSWQDALARWLAGRHLPVTS